MIRPMGVLCGADMNARLLTDAIVGTTSRYSVTDAGLDALRAAAPEVARDDDDADEDDGLSPLQRRAMDTVAEWLTREADTHVAIALRDFWRARCERAVKTRRTLTPRRDRRSKVDVAYTRSAHTRWRRWAGIVALCVRADYADPTGTRRDGLEVRA